MKFTYPSHLCVTSNGQLCISFAGSNQLILCEIDGKVIVSFCLISRDSIRDFYF